MKFLGNYNAKADATSGNSCNREDTATKGASDPCSHAHAQCETRLHRFLQDRTVCEANMKSNFFAQLKPKNPWPDAATLPLAAMYCPLKPWRFIVRRRWRGNARLSAVSLVSEFRRICSSTLPRRTCTSKSSEKSLRQGHFVPASFR